MEPCFDSPFHYHHFVTPNMLFIFNHRLNPWTWDFIVIPISRNKRLRSRLIPCWSMGLSALVQVHSHHQSFL
jgi:hypothetical protein